MKQIMACEHYSVGFNKEKNRLYMKMIGFWAGKEIALGYKKESDNALSLVQEGFTAVIDLSAFKIPKPEVMEIIAQTQKSFLNKGLTFSAEIVSANIFAEHAIDKIKEKNTMNTDSRAKFSSLQEAESWLDEVSGS